ncbi:MAG: Fic family protein [Acidobacteria bacterium]|nr:Fic family protein [Acidobacteriota bacterium]
MAGNDRPETTKTAAGRRIEEYCTEEVWRQGHNIHIQEGQERVRWMMEAWTFARRLAERNEPVTVDAIEKIGKFVEQVENRKGFRTRPVMIAGHLRAQPKDEIRTQLTELCGRQTDLPALEWYKEFEHVHPFIDGNGRTGKVLLAWLTATWDDPAFPPADLFGRPIRNP